ncbi:MULTISPECIES: hypothetical protein [Actinosynnema]|uniref:hypothetical protein n=1 Tax=Actinosynnema TaxID=40566 RepID=UPI0020A4628C|nr:hypothetical protein [Actinosynnema pretiosum]MCP2097501.1 hypothetical protein [Actinosynnema pretiosum]
MPFTNREQPDARKSQARALSTRPGMSYAAALRQVVGAVEPWQSKHLWVLTDDVRNWLSGDSRRSDHRNLYAWLDNEGPTFTCDRCGEPGDARTAECSISPMVTAYDPDLAPVTRHLDTKKYHATCAPSSVIWVNDTDIPVGPRYLDLPMSVRQGLMGRFELNVYALLDVDPEDGAQHAMLLLTVRVVEDHGRGVFAWLTELELYLGSQGIGDVHELDNDAKTDWWLRVVTDQASARPSWIALRTDREGNDDRARHHLILTALDLPDGWAQAAQSAGDVELVVGPCTRHWDSTSVPEQLADEIADFAEEQASATGDRCGCVHLTSNHAVDLVGSGAFLVGRVRVLHDEEVSRESYRDDCAGDATGSTD